MNCNPSYLGASYWWLLSILKEKSWSLMAFRCPRYGYLRCEVDISLAKRCAYPITIGIRLMIDLNVIQCWARLVLGWVTAWTCKLLGAASVGGPVWRVLLRVLRSWFCVVPTVIPAEEKSNRPWERKHAYAPHLVITWSLDHTINLGLECVANKQNKQNKQDVPLISADV